MNVIENLKVDTKIKEILDSGGFFRDVESYLRRSFPYVSRGISRRSIRRYCRSIDLRRFSARRADLETKEKAIKYAVREVRMKCDDYSIKCYTAC